MRERKNLAQFYLEDALKEADIYVNGDTINIKSREINSRLNEAIGRLVDIVFFKLSYIDTAMDERDIDSLFKAEHRPSLRLEGGTEPNQQALDEVLRFIENNNLMHSKVSLKRVKDQFMKSPYGFIDDDVEWLVAKLFNDNKIALYLSGRAVNKLDGVDERVRYITRKEFVDKLLIEVRETPPNNQIKAAKDIMKELFNQSMYNEDDFDVLMDRFQTACQELVNDFERLDLYYRSNPYPGQSIIDEGKTLLKSIIHIRSTKDFYKTVFDEYDHLLDLADDYEPIEAFFDDNKKEQRQIFDQAIKSIQTYEKSKNFIHDQQLESTIQQIQNIISMEVPFREIPKLPDLNQRFLMRYINWLDDMSKPILEMIKEAQEDVFDRLNTKPYKDEFEERFYHRFKDLKKDEVS